MGKDLLLVLYMGEDLLLILHDLLVVLYVGEDLLILHDMCKTLSSFIFSM